MKLDKLDKEEKTILEVQSEFEVALQHLASLGGQLPDQLKPLAKLAPRNGMRARVSLRKNERKVSKNLPAARWLPNAGHSIDISYSASTVEDGEALDTPAVAPTKSSPTVTVHTAEDQTPDI